MASTTPSCSDVRYVKRSGSIFLTLPKGAAVGGE
jgi:hypothetical protein